MTRRGIDQERIREYRREADSLLEASSEIQKRFYEAIAIRDLQGARDAFAELQAESKPFQELRSALTPEERFVTEYGVVLHSAHEISFVLPAGVSHLQLLEDAQQIMAERFILGLVEQYISGSDLFTSWSERGYVPPATPFARRIKIDGHVEGGDGKTLLEQQELLRARGLSMPKMYDLAVAFMGYYLIAGQSLFGIQKEDQLFSIRALDGALGVNRQGLHEARPFSGSAFAWLGVAASVEQVV